MLKEGCACAVSVKEHYWAEGRLCVRCAVMVPTGLNEGCACAVSLKEHYCAEGRLCVRCVSNGCYCAEGRLCVRCVSKGTGSGPHSCMPGGPTVQSLLSTQQHSWEMQPSTSVYSWYYLFVCVCTLVRWGHYFTLLYLHPLFC